MKEIRPPRWCLKFLKWFCKPAYHLDIEGDLLELYTRRVNAFGHKKANILLYRDIALLFRPGIIRSISVNHYTLSYPSMLTHNLLITYRSFLRYKSSFLINLIGLSTGLACTLLIYLWVQDELAVDKFFNEEARLFQVMRNTQNASQLQTTPYNPGVLTQVLADEIPAIDTAITVVGKQFAVNGSVSYEENQFRSMERYVSANFFEIFSFPIIQGNVSNVLTDKSKVVISEELALKLFPSVEDAMRKKIEWKREAFFGDVSGIYQISGVFKKHPNSSEDFDLVFSIDLYNKYYLRESSELWVNNSTEIFVVIKEGTKIDQLNHQIKNLIFDKSANTANTTLFLQKYSSRYLYNKYENGQAVGGRIQYVQLFSLIALLILIVACFNFMNLSTARASRRVKEIGVKKVLGANRKSLIIQFLSESILVSMLSLIIGLILVYVLVPKFNLITGKDLRFAFFSSNQLIFVLGLTILTGIFAGIYPALYLSKFKPALILRGRINTNMAEAFTRKGLVIIQFLFSTILIVSVFITYEQMKLMYTKNLGLNRNNIIMFQREGRLNENMDNFLQKIQELPRVMKASSMNFMLPGKSGSFDGLSWNGKGQNINVSFDNLEVGLEFLEVLGVEMKEGRSFVYQDGAIFRNGGQGNLKIVVNESAVKAMGLEHPIGEIIKDGELRMQIIGVTKDFHYSSLHEKVKPTLIRFISIPNRPLKYGLVKIAADKQMETIEQIEKYAAQFNDGIPLEVSFLDESYRSAYFTEERLGILSRYFTALAILISCLGLFGLSIFTAEIRQKEMGIRKVLGASSAQLVRILSLDITIMVTIAILIGLPVSYFLTQNWLANFAYKIELHWGYFVSAGLLSLIIAWFTISFQTIKTAMLNPIECLSNE